MYFPNRCQLNAHIDRVSSRAIVRNRQHDPVTEACRVSPRDKARLEHGDVGLDIEIRERLRL